MANGRNNRTWRLVDMIRRLQLVPWFTVWDRVGLRAVRIAFFTFSFNFKKFHNFYMHFAVQYLKPKSSLLGGGSIQDFIIWWYSMVLRLSQTWKVFFLLFSFGEARPEPFPPPLFSTKSLGMWRIHSLSKYESKRPLLRKAIISQDSVKRFSITAFECLCARVL